MAEIDSKEDIISRVERCLRQGKRIILFEHGDESLITMLVKKLTLKGENNTEIWYRGNNDPNGSCLVKLSNEDFEEVLKLYRLYDFSDKVSLVAESSQYGTMFNYVRNEILSIEEMVDAILFNH